MLLFIDVEPDVPFTEIYFNTSHVTVYQHITCQSTTETEFQYISCYCLSTATLLIACCVPYFNTSHVTVYRRSLPEAGTYTSISIHLMLLFIQKEKRQWRTWIYFNTSHVTVYQQISVFDSSGVTHFNTSHVTVYHVAHGGYNAACLFQYISCYCLSLLVDSLPCPDHISIHLMLLFIA